jgi:2-dehydro-3-deoxygluconokinase
MTSGVASIGECMIELSGAGEGMWRLGYAGDTLNTLWAIRALVPADTATDYLSAFGDDPFSEKQLAFFAENHIGVASSPRIAGARPGLYAITLDGAERSFTYWRNDAAARQLASDSTALSESLKGRALVYFSGITLAILAMEGRDVLFAALKEARRAGSLIAFDPNYRPRLWASVEEARSVLDRFAAVVDIALPTFPDEQMLHGDTSAAETAKRLHALGISEIVVKDGENPALVFSKNGTGEVPAIRVTAVDTTGAGDSFNGGYLAARLRALAPLEAAARAHSVAASVVQVRGALASFHTLRAAFNG